MSLKYLYTIDEFNHNGINIPIKVWHDKGLGYKSSYRFEFEYKNCSVYDWYYYEDNSDAYSLTRLYCKIIDKYGIDSVERFKLCKKKLSQIRKNYIIVDNKVFKFDKEVMDISPHKIHCMQIEMTDGEILDGNSFMNRDFYIKDKDEYSYKKTLDNLRGKVESYFKDKKIFPCKKFFLEKETKVYKELLLEYQQMIK